MGWDTKAQPRLNKDRDGGTVGGGAGRGGQLIREAGDLGSRGWDLLGSRREEAVSCHRLHTSVWYFERRLVVGR